MSATDVTTYLRQVRLPDRRSHKGQNGKLLILGGSELFHAASKWSLDVASHFVDMVFYASVPGNNDLMREAKGQFWNGIVISQAEIANYMTEADCILIGPGMQRTPETAALVDSLLRDYPDKKWVIDAGALQMVTPKLITGQCILTPHQQEFALLMDKVVTPGGSPINEQPFSQALLNTGRGMMVSQILKGACLLIKGEEDVVVKGDQAEKISGGNAGMTKGGTGDVLAGLVAALYCTNEALTAAVVGSYINKKAGEWLFTNQGPFFNASELVTAIPKVLWREISAVA